MTAPNPYTPGTLPNPLNPLQVAGAVTQVAGTLPGAQEVNALIDGITATRRWMADRHNWIRIGWWAAGSACIYIGVGILARKPIAGVVKGTVDTVGKVV